MQPKTGQVSSLPPHMFPKQGFEPGGLECMPCCFCASQGFTMGNADGMLNITHGPPGCSYHIWGLGAGVKYSDMTFSTNLKENDVIFGGEEKLMEAIGEAVKLFSPEVIGVFNTCVPGLTGDKTENVCRRAQERYGVRVVPFLCEGFKNVTGFDYASGVVAGKLYGQDETGSSGAGYPINFAASTYGGENRPEYDRIFQTLGYQIVSTLFSRCDTQSLAKGHRALFTAAEGGRPLENYAQTAGERFGLRVLTVNFTGIQNTSCSLLKMAKWVGDMSLTQRTSAFIEAEARRVRALARRAAELWKGIRVIIKKGGVDGMAYHTLLNELGVPCQVETKADMTESMFLIEYADGKRWFSPFFQGMHGMFYSCFEGVLRFARHFDMEVRMGRRLLDASDGGLVRT